MKWWRHIHKKVSHSKKPSFPGEWEQMKCGAFFYSDMITWDDTAPKCKKCLKIEKEATQ